ncbi:MAG TPA: glycosyl transferase, partial [Bacteroidia bacterium]|nr:glycosyl transferase [Bacteroidia bacterium]
MKSKKKILIFIDWFLPGFKAGGPIQSCANLIEHFKNEADFFVVTRDTDYCEKTPYKNIKSNTWVDFSDGTKVYYFSKKELNRKNIQKIIFSDNFDLIYLNGIYSRYFTLVPLFLLRKRKEQKIILSVRGMLAESAISVKKTKKKMFLNFAKRIHLFKNVTFHATSIAEENDIRKQFGNSVIIKIAPNLPAIKKENEWIAKTKNSGKLLLINVARIAPEKNLFFALEILKEAKCEIQFDFYGPIYDEMYFEKCQQLISK